jgi:serine O-acetyltransferase
VANHAASDTLQSIDSAPSGKQDRPSAQDAPDSQPRFLDALLADARVAAAYRGERTQFRSRLDGIMQALRLMLVTDAFLAQAAYRAKARLQALGVPILPWIAHRIAMMTAQISISDAAVIRPGVFIPHGQVVIQGMSVVHPGAILSAWVTIGLIGSGVVGPTIGPRARIGTGAKLLGPIKVGRDARVGANSVVLNDVPPDTTVVGAPAKAATD